ncbi:hypothetical protein [uncultured Methanolobus sp.]|uniref:hypothetical protein n=1 Tax=uncultured Methanolobus sp. TaxID=218300 RepID=UPI002AAB011E|nr:hypothetical protein [uncultured Methanolobus sp.]
MSKDDIDFEEEIIAYLNKNGKMRRERLIDVLIEKHTKPNEKGQGIIDLGYSKPTLNRRLKELIDSGKIISIGYEELIQYGFKVTDQRAKYLFTSEGLKLKQHIDEMLNLLMNGDEIDKQMALKELNRYETMYSFDESQLDLLVQNLTTGNPDLTNRFLITLKTYIIDKGKEPDDKDALLKSLKTVLDKYADPKGKSGHVRNVAMCLLCHYKDEAIIDQIEKDATSSIDLQKAEEDYDPSSIADIVVNNPSRLFNLERELMKEGKNDAAQFVSNIRYKCMDHLGMIDHSKQEEAERSFDEAVKKALEEGNNQ